MLNKNFKIQLLGTLLFAVLLVFGSCKKEADTLAVIIVKNSAGHIVSNASVKLSPDSIRSPGGLWPDPSLTKINKTDVNGQVEFTYELEVILNIDVTKVEGNSIYTGTNIIRLLRGKVITKEVEIN